ncbi:translesion DNA synthesis-associated protein ImuA [Flagellatimonas centrodinii]|uniref:translesion DNA synthesis-associated protein ImuA n=1 Tax=Flagellatimonas centrodinii TaxID=2806210 RepID=UPI001FEF7FB3|nr:translesion DNA synthesis-associated protein ImuA [Flagellatimonas centrodinii]ULQ45992.1 translesion DNA synthesis-associated protein ImuA [Flagellatimonas centrodinii]
MSAVPAELHALLDAGQVWRGQTRHRVAAMPTGFAALDASLPGGGWPLGALSEVLHAAPGCGELRLVLPLLARLSQAGRPLALVAPPLTPYAPGWAQAGVVLSRLVVVDAEGHGVVDAASQLLQAGASTVCLWQARLDDTDVRRLSLAAETAGAPLLWMRQGRGADLQSSAALRLRVQRQGSGLQVDVLKVRGGRAQAGLTLPL